MMICTNIIGWKFAKEREWMTEDSIATLMSAVALRRKELDEENRRTGMRLNLLCLLQPNEMDMSKILAEFLLPTGSHGQGDVFLKTFLSAAGLSDYETTGEIVVRLEDTTQMYRRIDLVVSGVNWIVGIENKPWANDQSGQIHDYVNELKQRAGKRKYKLIYWSQKSPSEKSIGEAKVDEEWVRLEYRKTVEAFRGLLSRNDLSLPARVRETFEILLEWMEIQFLDKEGGVPMERRAILDLIRNDESNLQAALAIADAFEDLCNDLHYRMVEELKKELEDRFKARGGQVAFEGIEKGQTPKASAKVFLRNPHWQYVDIALEFGKAGYRNAAVGIPKKSKLDSIGGISPVSRGSLVHEGRRLNEALRKHFGVGNSSDWWEWWSDLDSPSRDWRNAKVMQILTNDQKRKEFVDSLVERFENAWKALTDLEVGNFTPSCTVSQPMA